MAYTPFENSTPDPSTENGTTAFDSTRENLLAMRDALIAFGNFPGWDCAAQNSNGSTPPTDPTQPYQFVWSRGTERIKMVCTWGTTGGEDDNLTDAVFSYSSNSGSSYDLIADTDYPLGKVSLTYDANANYLSHSWS